MCIFSGPIEDVSSTRIFARSETGGRQCLAYAMKVTFDAELAMVLPLPVPVSSREDAVVFIDLSAYPKLFEDLSLGVFPVPAAAPQPDSFGLKVHDVGAFVASFVPTLADFARLDPRFSLADDVWSALPQYQDWGFAVFALKPPSERMEQDVHPMAFSFPRRDPGRLFFPTVHVHDGVVHEQAEFRHVLFYQRRQAEPEQPVAAVGPGAPSVTDQLLDVFRSFRPAGAFVDIERAAGVVAGDRHVYGRTIYGTHENRDVLVDDPL